MFKLGISIFIRPICVLHHYSVDMLQELELKKYYQLIMQVTCIAKLWQDKPYLRLNLVL